MGLVAAKCTQCGANIEVDDQRKQEYASIAVQPLLRKKQLQITILM